MKAKENGRYVCVAYVEVLNVINENTCSNLCGKDFLDYPKSDITQI